MYTGTQGKYISKADVSVTRVGEVAFSTRF